MPGGGRLPSFKRLTGGVEQGEGTWTFGAEDCGRSAGARDLALPLWTARPFMGVTSHRKGRCQPQEPLFFNTETQRQIAGKGFAG